MQPSVAATAEAGWYADPAGTPAVFRWWDGARWSDWLSDDPSAAPPPARRAATAADDLSVGSDGDPVADDLSDDEATSPEDGEPPYAPPTGRPMKMYPPGYERRTRRPATDEPRPSGARLPRVLGVAAVIVALAVVVAVVVYGNRVPASPLAGPLVTAPAGSGASGSASPQPSATPVSVVYDAANRKVTIGTFKAELPNAPYRAVSEAPQPVAGILSSGLNATAVVQPSYDGTRDWQATMAVGLLDVDVIQNDDATKTARNVFAAYNELGFPGIKVNTSKVTVSKAEQVGVERGAIVQGRVNYKVKGVTSSYDQVSVLVVKLTDGPWVGWMSSRPEKTPSATMKVLRDAIGTITT